MNWPVVFKIVGALLTATGAALKFFKTKPTPDQETDSDTRVESIKRNAARMEKIEWGVILGGLLVTLFSSVFEQHQSTTSAAEARRQNSIQLSNATQQITLARRSIDDLQRLLNPLDSITVTVVGEVPTNSLGSKILLGVINPDAQRVQKSARRFGKTLNRRILANLINQGVVVTDHVRDPEDPDVAVGYMMGRDYFEIFIGGPLRGKVEHRLVETNAETHIGLNSLTNKFWESKTVANGVTWSRWASSIRGLNPPYTSLRLLLKVRYPQI